MTTMMMGDDWPSRASVQALLPLHGCSVPAHVFRVLDLYARTELGSSCLPLSPVFSSFEGSSLRIRDELSCGPQDDVSLQRTVLAQKNSSQQAQQRT